MPQRRVRKHVNPLGILTEHSFEGFKDQNPIWVDIGSAKGEFAAKLTEKYSEKNFILCEIRKPLARKLETIFSEKKNVVVFDGDAGRNFKNLLFPSIEQGAIIEKVFINFPDPWLKDRHKKRRFVSEKFLDSLSKWVPSETEFIFQTDQEGLFNDTLEILENSKFSKIERFSEPYLGVMTDWEKAKIEENSEIFRIKFWRKKDL